MSINAKYIRNRRFARTRYGSKLLGFVASVATALSATAASHTVTPVHASQLGPEATFTISGGSIAALDTVTLGSVLYKFVTALTEVFAHNTLTTDNTNASDTSTVVVNGKTYTLQGTLTNVDGHVHIGTDADTTLLNLARAINGSGGTAGTDYAAANVAHTTVSASATVTSHAITLTAKTSGTAPNAYTLALAGTTHLTVGGATFTGGIAPSAFNEVLVGNGTTGARDNLIAAITASGAAGKYQTNIVVNSGYTASASSANVLVQKKTAKGKDALIFSSTAAHGAAGAFSGPFWTATGHGLTEGAGPFLLTNTGGALPTGSPALGTDLYVHVVDVNTIGIAVGREALREGSYFGTSTAGTGTTVLKRSVVEDGIFETLKRTKPATVAVATDIDGL